MIGFPKSGHILVNGTVPKLHTESGWFSFCVTMVVTMCIIAAKIKFLTIHYTLLILFLCLYAHKHNEIVKVNFCQPMYSNALTICWATDTVPVVSVSTVLHLHKNFIHTTKSFTCRVSLFLLQSRFQASSKFVLSLSKNSSPRPGVANVYQVARSMLGLWRSTNISKPLMYSWQTCYNYKSQMCVRKCIKFPCLIMCDSTIVSFEENLRFK